MEDTLSQQGEPGKEHCGYVHSRLQQFMVKEGRNMTCDIMCQSVQCRMPRDSCGEVPNPWWEARDRTKRLASYR